MPPGWRDSSVVVASSPGRSWPFDRVGTREKCVSGAVEAQPVAAIARASSKHLIACSSVWCARSRRWRRVEGEAVLLAIEGDGDVDWSARPGRLDDDHA